MVGGLAWVCPVREGSARLVSGCSCASTSGTMKAINQAGKQKGDEGPVGFAALRWWGSLLVPLGGCAGTPLAW